MDWLTGEWSDPHFLVNPIGKPWHEDCRDKVPGVYRLVALASPGLPGTATLNRVCGSDPTGTIYIGAARILRNRVGKLIAQHQRSYGHKKPSDTLSAKFPPRVLAVCWQYVDGSDDPFRREHELMTAYKAAFGETPPLNGQG